MTNFLTAFAKNIRSVIAYTIIIGCFIYMFVHPDNARDVVPIMMVVVAYYFVESKNRSDQQKAEIEIKKQEILNNKS